MKTTVFTLSLPAITLALASPQLHRAGFARAPTGKGNVYWHSCGNCKCNASGSRKGFTGDSGCLPIDHSIHALSLTLTGSKSTTCSVFTSGNCSGNIAQSVSATSGQTYSCTALNQDSGSILCYYNI